MNVGGILVLGGTGVIALLVIRRALRIRRAVSKWKLVASSVGLSLRPRGFFRVAITGGSRGIGAACIDLLREYPTVEVMNLSRSASTAESIHVDLCKPESVRAAASELRSRWLGHSHSAIGGHDILINNAGVFGSHSYRDTVLTNLIAPCFLTETLASSVSDIKQSVREFRVVNVGSRLERNSNLSAIEFGGFASTIRNPSDNIRSANEAYADSKRGLMFHTAHMCSRFSGCKQLSFTAVTPGMVNTSLGQNSVSPFLWYLTAPLRFLFIRHPIEGAVAVLWAAFAGENGTYSADPGEVLERISETRDVRAGALVSDLVHEIISPV